MHGLNSKLILLLLLFLGACASSGRRAPVSERQISEQPASVSPKEEAKDWRPKVYTVRKGDTLYSIALEHGLDYKDLANWNGVSNPGMIKVGESLRLFPREEAPEPAPVTRPLVESAQLNGGKPLPPSVAPDSATLKTKPVAQKLAYSDQAFASLQPPSAVPVAPPAPAEKAPAADAALPTGRIDWAWPADGKVIKGFSETANLKGIDIAGKAGEPVLASAPGKVVYTGNGLRGYGKLIIIKHDKNYLSAYAHNSQISVKEGQTVTKGEKIGEMGNTDADQVMLHFEIRYLGKPVDPMKYLKERHS